MPRLKKIVPKKIKGLKKPLQSPKGVKDILPEEQYFWDFVLNTSRKLCENFGYQKIEIPVLEDTALFERGVGADTDIVEKEMYSFTTLGGDDLTLRPEGTAGIVRAFIENGMAKRPHPVKLYYEGPMFRYENPQAGRLREFHQFGFEILGESSPIIDAQMIYLAWKIFNKLGLKNTTIQVNSIGCLTCRSAYKKMLTDYYKSKVGKLCPDCRRRITRNPLRLLDCKEEKCAQVAALAPQILDYLCDDCHSHFKDVLEYLDGLELSYVLNQGLVRGLDYYTRTVFEIWPAGNSEYSGQDNRQSSFGGGGRYDDLVELLGGEPTPAAGFSFGIERTVEEIKKRDLVKKSKISRQVFLVQLGELAKKKSLKLFNILMDSRILVAESLGRGSIKSQLKMANKFGVKLSLIVGQKEALDETIIIRDMDSGTQEIVAMEKIVKEVKKRLGK